MSALAVEQLDLWNESPVVVSTVEDGIGRVLYSLGGGWRARYTGSRYGWQIDRATTYLERHRYWVARGRSVVMTEPVLVWEAWEPELPYGVEHVHDRDLAVALLTGFSDRHGDDPDWLVSRYGDDVLGA